MGRETYGLKITRLTYGMTEHPHVGTWLLRSVMAVTHDPRLRKLAPDGYQSICPVDMAHNKALFDAKKMGMDYLCMIDNDVLPDLSKGAPPFLISALNFVMKHDGPCMVAAPVLNRFDDGDKVCVYDWHTDTQTGRRKMQAVPVEQCAGLTGFGRVQATGTGLVLIDLDCLEKIRTPWFEFVYYDEYHTDGQMTDDVNFCLKLGEAGVPIYAAWDSPAEHFKPLRLGVDKSTGKTHGQAPKTDATVLNVGPEAGNACRRPALDSTGSGVQTDHCPNRSV